MKRSSAKLSTIAGRVGDLENRIATLEGLSQERQSEWDEVVSGWKDVLREFCQDYELNIPDQLKQTESRI